MIIVKIYLGISLELLRSVWSLQFQIVPCSSLYFFSRSTGPFQCLINVNYRVLICCTCHLQSRLPLLYFGFLCLQVSSVSNFCPDTRGQRWSLIQAYLFSCWRRQWHPTPVLLPGKFHGRRSPVGCRPWGCEELGTTERLHFHFSLSCIGEGNGNPLQCSCLENARDMLWGGRKTANKYHWLVWGVLAVYGLH